MCYIGETGNYFCFPFPMEMETNNHKGTTKKSIVNMCILFTNIFTVFPFKEMRK